MTFANAEALLRAAMIERPLAEWEVESITTEVPNPRPDRFITIERTGGISDRWQDRPQVAIQCWAKSRWEAEELASRVKTWVNEVLRYHPQVSRVGVGWSYNFPDPDSRQPRFQVLVDFRTSAH